MSSFYNFGTCLVSVLADARYLLGVSHPSSERQHVLTVHNASQQTRKADSAYTCYAMLGCMTPSTIYSSTWIQLTNETAVSDGVHGYKCGIDEGEVRVCTFWVSWGSQAQLALVGVHQGVTHPAVKIWGACLGPLKGTKQAVPAILGL